MVLVQVGGSWQNTDPAVRQANQTWMQPGSLVDASSSGAGDGGTVVVWSDLETPRGALSLRALCWLAVVRPLAMAGGLRRLVLSCWLSREG